MARRQKEAPSKASLEGWNAIAGYLGQPVATAQRWAKTGMPVRRAGRFVVSEPEELNRWLGRESGLKQPAHVAHTGEPDLIADLKLGLKAVRNERPSKKRTR
jgi:hypothetical protein